MQDGQHNSMQQSDLSGKMARGVAWMAVLKLAVRSLAIISTLILVRLLQPGDFGVVAMAMFLSQFLSDVVV
jgi:Polysaccharide biosynthesis protein.